jgi:acetate kinase
METGRASMKASSVVSKANEAMYHLVAAARFVSAHLGRGTSASIGSGFVAHRLGWTEAVLRFSRAARRIGNRSLGHHFCSAVARFHLSLLAGMAPSIIAHVGSGRWIVGPIALGAVAIIRAHGV